MANTNAERHVLQGASYYEATHFTPFYTAFTCSEGVLAFIKPFLARHAA